MAARKRRITTIVVDPATHKAGQDRARELGYKSFNQYMVALVEIDLRDQPDHVVIRKSKTIQEGQGESEIRETPTPQGVAAPSFRGEVRRLRLPSGETPPDQVVNAADKNDAREKKTRVARRT